MSTDWYGRRSRHRDDVAQRLELLHRSGCGQEWAGEVVPVRYHDAHLLRLHDTPERRAALPFLKAWVNNGMRARRWLWLTGAYGSGKTHIMAALLRAANASGYSCAWRSWADMALRTLRMATDKAKRERIVGRAIDADILFLDDFAKSGEDLFLDARQLDLAWQVLDARYAARRPTVISCQADFTFLEDQGDIGKALLSRISAETFPERGSIIQVGSRDLRGSDLDRPSAQLTLVG